MIITIRDCMGLPAFENAKVYASEELLDKKIKSVSVLEGTKPSDIIDRCDLENQMVVTGFFGIREDAKAQCVMVEEISKRNCAALVLHAVGRIVEKVDQELIEMCQKIELPLIVIDESKEILLSEIIEEVSQKLFYGATAIENRLISNTVFDLLNFEKYADFTSAIKAAARNNNFQLIVLSPDFNPVLTVENQYKTTVDKAIRMGREKAVEKRSSLYTAIEVDGVLTYWGPISIQGSGYYMFIVDNEDSYSKDEIIKLADIIEIAMGMWKYTPAKDQKAEFIKALRRGNANIAYALKEEAGIDESKILSVFLGNGFSMVEIQPIIDKYCNEHHLNIIQIIEGDETFGIVLGDSSRTVCSKLYEEIKTKDSRIFHVTGVESVESACDAFRLINETAVFTQKIFPFKRAFSKYDLSLISNCNNIQLRGGFIKKNYIKLLEPFEADKSQKGRQLLETLETFVLDAGMNGSKTAEIMNIHTNTVQYRLKKISDLLGAEITANRVIPGLTIALALKRLERA
ncbi:MAG: PucR family transcriptional regulator [Eubacterium sp.]|nr:PucR family transcriptional regulator [Eubacterium sp.]